MVQVTPIANLESFGSEWILDISWTTPSTPNTLAKLVWDLTQTASVTPEIDSPGLHLAEPQLTLSNLFEVDRAEADAVEIEPVINSATEIFDSPATLDLGSALPPIEPIEIQQLEQDSASLNQTLANAFEFDPAIAPEHEPTAKPEWVTELEPEAQSEPAAKLQISPAVEPDQLKADPDQPEPPPAQTRSDRVAAETLAEVRPELDPATLDQLNQLLAEPAKSAELLTAPPKPRNRETEAQPDAWFLGIDIGTTGISAVLLNQAQYQLYPLYWQSVAADGINDTNDAETNANPSIPSSKQFRLSTTVTLATANPTDSALPTIRLEPAPSDAVRLHLSDWKPYLKLAVPHYSPQTAQWEPVLQWADPQSVPLRTLQEALQQLLATLHPDRASFMPALRCAALGLETDLPAVGHHLAGIVVGYPSNWSDTYRFNVREAILQAELVTRPDQIVFLEEAIAALLSALPAADGHWVNLAHPQGQSGHLHNADWRGVTLILTAGASLTELVLVNLPQQLEQLNPTDFYVRSLPYAGQGIDQDILSQLIYPALLSLDPEATPAETALDPDFVIEPFDLSTLGLANLNLPAAAELDFSKRYRFQQQLLSSNAGQPLLTAAQSLKITLQHQPRFTVQFGAQQCTIQRQDLTSRVLLPYVQRLNRELNTLLAQTNTTAAAVSQVICTGGTASLGALARWLRQKLPNALIIQDTYPRLASRQDNSIPSCSRVAYGLATLPLHPQVIDQAQHQYSDYFLLLELLRALPNQPVQLETIMQLLAERGIDTQACRFRILALLDGHLPPGLVPADSDLALLTLESAINPDYQAIQFAPVFAKQADRTYQPNQPQRDYLQQYLETLLADTEQTLEQPLKMGLGLGAEF